MTSSHWYSWHDKNPAYFDQGPRSFYEYAYNSRQIFLIGDQHVSSKSNHSIPLDYKKQYIDIFNQFVEKNTDQNKKIKIFLEITPEYTKTSKNETSMNFIDCIANVRPRKNVEVVAADDRIWNLSLKHFAEFIFYMTKVKSKVRNVHQAITAYDKQGNSTGLLSWLQMQTCFLNQIKELSSFLNRYQNDPYLMLFLTQCFLKLHAGLDELEKVVNEYTTTFPTHHVEDKSVVEMCKEMMQHRNNFSSLSQWFSIALAYFQPFLAGTLTCKLWSEINHDQESSQIIVIVAGNNLIEDIAKFLSEHCSQIQSISQKQHSTSIIPQKLQEYLQGMEQNNKHERNCIMM